MNNEISLEFLLRILALTSNISYMDIWWRTDGNYAPASIFVNCNNVFEPGVADCERITPTNIDMFEEASKDIRAITDNADEYIPMLFCARLRNRRPIDNMYPENEALWPLFNACGPYVLYPDVVGVRPVAPMAEEPSLNWWRRFIEFFKNLLDTISTNIYGGFCVVREKIENLRHQ